MRTTVPTVTLNTGAEMPILGFGAFPIPPEDSEQAVTTGQRQSSVRAVAGTIGVGPRRSEIGAAHDKSTAQVVLRWLNSRTATA